MLRHLQRRRATIQVIILDGGTTSLQVAQHLPYNLRATVITHSPPVALALAEYPEIEIVVIGGKLYKHGLVTVGSATFAAFRNILADLCFLGIASLHPARGFRPLHLETPHLNRALLH